MSVVSRYILEIRVLLCGYQICKLQIAGKVQRWGGAACVQGQRRHIGEGERGRKGLSSSYEQQATICCFVCNLKNSWGVPSEREIKAALGRATAMGIKLMWLLWGCVRVKQGLPQANTHTHENLQALDIFLKILPNWNGWF